jgi:rhomboid protease GluP
MNNIFSTKMSTKSSVELEEIVNSEGKYVDKAILAALWELKNRDQLSKSNSDKLNMMEIDALATKKQKEQFDKHRKIEIADTLKFYFNFFTFRTQFKIVPLIIQLNLAVYALMILRGIDPIEPSPSELIYWGGNLTELSFSSQPWRLISHMFLHVDFFHLSFNLVVLGFIGPISELTLGQRRFLLSYLATGIGGGILSALSHDNVVSVGASGAIFGLFGIMVSIILFSKEKALRKKLLPSFIIFIGYNFILGLSNGGIDNAAHLGGLLTGILIGIILQFTSFRKASILEKITQANNGEHS